MGFSRRKPRKTVYHSPEREKNSQKRQVKDWGIDKEEFAEWTSEYRIKGLERD